MAMIGKQIATVNGVEIKYNASGVPYFAIVFKLADGEHKVGYLYTTEKAIGISRKGMKAIGFDIDNQSLDDLHEKPDMLNGNVAEIEIVEEEYKGKIKEKIAWINPVARSVTKADLQKLTHALRNAKGDNQDMDDQI